MLNILKLLKKRKWLEQFRIQDITDDQKTLVLITAYKRYYSLPQYQMDSVIDTEQLKTLFYTWYKIDPKEKTEYEALFKGIQSDLSLTDQEAAINELQTLKMMRELQECIQEYTQNGLEPEDIHESILTSFNTWINHYRTGDHKALDPSLDELFIEDLSSGYSFRLEPVNQAVRPLIPGDFVVFAARPDKGKTSFLASEMAWMCPQQNRDILWFNNEGLGKRIISRLYTTVLQKTRDQIIKDIRAGNSDLIKKEYSKKLRNSIKVYDIHGKNILDLEKIIKQEKPGIVIYDMLDNVIGTASDRLDLQLEKLYQTVREFGVKYNCVNICTSQISFEGDDLEYPGMSALKDSKTGKQGTADLICTLGSKIDPKFDHLRWLSFPKNKLIKEGSKSNKIPLKFNPHLNIWAA